MPTFLLILAILAGRLVLRVIRGLGYVIALPARTALALAPHSSRPRAVLTAGVVLTLASSIAAALLLLSGL